MPVWGEGPDLSQGADLAARVVIVANASVPDSLTVARHYAEARHVPAANIIALPMPTAETITWPEFVSGVWSPLLARLVRDGWIDAIEMDLTDSIGRRKYAVHGHRIAALVVCHGVPLRIAHDPALYADALPYTMRNEYRTNAGAVDSELSLLATPNYPINAFVANPLFQNDHPTDYDLAQVVKVSRLDGPDIEDVLALVDRAITTERDGLLGRAYVDLSDRDQIGNRWLESVAAQLDDVGFAADVDREPATFPATARFDAPVLYFGWYAHDLDGPFALPGFRFPPGAIALHIHSYSAETLTSTNAGWTGPFVARGVTATFGNVYEPYLHLTQRPDMLLRALLRGANLVDAAYYGLRALSWQAVLIGDPLYRPFAVSLDQQMARLAQRPPELAGYAVLRRVHQLDSAGHSRKATTLLRESVHDRPSLPVGLALAQRLAAAGDPAGAASALGLASHRQTLAPDEWGEAATAARLLEHCGHAAMAVQIWRTILGDARLPASLRTAWLGDAAAAATAAHNDAQAELWRSDLVPPGSGSAK